MKKYSIYISLLLTLLVSYGCNEILEENPKTTFTTDYYKTAQGYQDGLNAAYSYLRFQYGCNPALGLNVTGTDEFTFGPEGNYSSNPDNVPHKMYGSYNIAPQTDFLGITFNRTFPIINTMNALIAFAPDVAEFTEQQRKELLAQAHYLRAHYYYLLVAHFGAAPLDLGSGELKFNTTPFLGFNRGENETERQELLAKDYDAMISDLIFASENLPNQRLSTEYRLFKAVAFHLLSKVYLARSYSSVAQSTDAENAFEAANEVITNLETYGVALQQDFEQVFHEDNEYNSEILFAAERIPGDYVNNGYLNANADGIGDGENMAANCFTSFYQQGTVTALRDRPLVDPVNKPLPSSYTNGLVIDGRPYEFQRPLRKIAPTRWLTEVAFADKENDARYHGSFQTLWTAASQADPSGPTSDPARYNTFIQALDAYGMVPGDTAFYLADSPEEAQTKFGVSEANPYGTRYYKVYSSDNWYSNKLYPGPPAPADWIGVYPSLKKFNDSKRASFNGASGRPMPIFRLAETYLLAAEAAFKMGDASTAADLINVIRRRAAYRPGLDPGVLSAREDAMEIDAGDVSLDFILDERARELAGEGGRWTDLALRGEAVFVDRVSLNEDADGKVQPHHRLRPIPQSQLDAISDTDKQKYQNPGY